MLIGTFKNGKPTGQITVTVDGEVHEVESPFDEAQAEPAVEEEK